MRKNDKRLLWTATFKGYQETASETRLAVRLLIWKKLPSSCGTVFLDLGARKANYLGHLWEEKTLPLVGRALCSANWTDAQDWPLVVQKTLKYHLNLIKHCVRSMFDYLSDQNFISSLSVTAVVGKKQHSGLPGQLLRGNTKC